jgi:hypothetical protein
MRHSKAAVQLGTFLLVFGLSPSMSSAPDAPVAIRNSASHPVPLILNAGEGERRVRRVYGGATAIIKVDRQNGGAPELVMGSEELPPGQAIAAHQHPGADEIVFVHRGRGLPSSAIVRRSSKRAQRSTSRGPLA